MIAHFASYGHLSCLRSQARIDPVRRASAPEYPTIRRGAAVSYAARSRASPDMRELMRSLLGNCRSNLAEDPFKNVSDDFGLGL